MLMSKENKKIYTGDEIVSLYTTTDSIVLYFVSLIYLVVTIKFYNQLRESV